MLQKNRRTLGKLPGKLFAESTVGGTASLLIVEQGMDSSGKGEIVKHGLAGLREIDVNWPRPEYDLKKERKRVAGA
jgi:polyphosphate kinase 2 (PPK2 family)